MREKLLQLAAKILEEDITKLEFDGKRVFCEETGKEVSLFDLATASMVNNEIALEVTCSHSSPVSPPPFMAACAEVEVDPETGAIELLDYTACVDCGTVVNTNLARVQTEGGLLQGISQTPLCSTRFRPVLTLIKSAWNLRAVTSRPDLSVQNQSVRS